MFVSFVQTAIEIWKPHSGATQRELLVLHVAGMHEGFKCNKISTVAGICACNLYILHCRVN